MKSVGDVVRDARSRTADVRTRRRDGAGIEFAGLNQLEVVTGAPASRLPSTHPLAVRHWTARSRIYNARSWFDAFSRGEDDFAAA